MGHTDYRGQPNDLTIGKTMSLDTDPALTCHLKFEDALNDSSGNGNSGTLVGDPTGLDAFVRGKYGRGMTRDADGSMTIAYDSDFDETQFTVCCWVKIAAYPPSGLHSIFGKFDGGGADRQFVVYIDDAPTPGILLYSTKGTGGQRDIYGTTPLSLNTWHHIAFTSNGSSFQGWLDGVKDGTTGDTTSARQDVGADPVRFNFGTQAAVEFDDFRFYLGVVLSDTEIRQLASGYHGEGLNYDDDLLVHLKLQEAAGELAAVNAKDPGNYDGVVSGTGIDYDSDGPFGNCLKRTEINDIVTLTPSPHLTQANQTLSCFIRFDGVASSWYPIAAQDDHEGGLTMHVLNATTIRAQIYDGSSEAITTVPDMTDGEWHHLAFVYTQTEIYSYFDGVLGVLDGSISTDWDTAPDTTLFERDENSNNVDASLSDVRIFTRALTPQEIKYLARNPYGANLNDDPNLELLLKLDESTGGTAYDSSGYGRDGTLTGVSFTTDADTGKYGGALKFATAGDEINVGDIGLADMDTTYAAWMRWDAAQSGNVFVVAARGTATGGLSFYVVDVAGTTLAVAIGPTFLAQFTVTELEDGEWHHIALTYDASPTRTVYFYVDGVMVHSDNSLAVATWTTGVDVHVYNRDGWDSTQDVSFDDIRIYSRMLSPQEIRTLYNPYGRGLNNDPHLELLLKLDETVNNGAPGGADALDQSPHGRHGTLTGLDFTADSVEGKYGEALHKDAGTGQYLDCGELSLGNIDQTYSTWLKGTIGVTTTGYVIANQNGSIGGLSIFRSGADAFSAYVGPTLQSTLTLSAGDFNDGEWHHLALSWDSADEVFRWYYDGVGVSVDIDNTGTWAAGIDVHLFERVGATGGHVLTLDDVRIYSRVLAANEVRALSSDNLYGAGSKMQQLMLT
jgi:hypothetical protein